MAHLNNIGDMNRAQIKALFKLRGTLTLRQFSQERGRLVVALLVVLVLLPMALGIAFATGIGYRNLPDHWPEALLGGVLFLLWMLWITLPIFVSPINEAFDLSRLMIYPVRQRDLITAVFLGTLFDYPTYIMLPLFAAIIFGFGSVSSILIVLIALLLTYGHLIMIGQLVGTAIGGLLQSRRVRDATIIFMSVLGGSCYFINLTMQRFFENMSNRFSEDQVEALLAQNPLDFLQWLPPGAAAKAIERANTGEWLQSLVWLAYSTVWLAVVIWVWYKLLSRLATGEGYLFSRSAKKMVVETAVSTQTINKPKRDWFAWLPDDIAVIAHKELVTIWRLPQRRAGIIQSLLFPVLMSAFFLVNNNRPNYPVWVGLGLPLYALIVFWGATQNLLAWEGRGLPALLLTPNPRHRIFIGKGIVLAAIVSVPYILFGCAVIWITQHWLSVAGILTGLCVGIATIGITSIASVLFPMPINLESKQNRGSFKAGGSFKSGCANVLVAPIASALTAVPPILPLIAAYWFKSPWIALLGILFSVVYAVLVFRFGCYRAAKFLLQREPELVLAMKLPDED